MYYLCQSRMHKYYEFNSAQLKIAYTIECNSVEPIKRFLKYCLIIYSSNSSRDSLNSKFSLIVFITFYLLSRICILLKIFDNVLYLNHQK